MSFWGPIIGAGISTLGGMHANRENAKLNRESRAHQEHVLKNQISAELRPELCRYPNAERISCHGARRRSRYDERRHCLST